MPTRVFIFKKLKAFNQFVNSKDSAGLQLLFDSMTDNELTKLIHLKYRELIQSFITKTLNQQYSHENKDDVYGDFLLKVGYFLKSYEPRLKQASFTTFLVKIVTNFTKNYLRSERKRWKNERTMQIGNSDFDFELFDLEDKDAQTWTLVENIDLLKFWRRELSTLERKFCLQKRFNFKDHLMSTQKLHKLQHTIQTKFHNFYQTY
ncbi:hypothetical protein [Mycoplasmopsis columbinasalis]|uniref:Uncharacterized protein n=1 Tax=Mycoplasmopsis columbinasalis TaxID=114880 RepID=A0A449BAQ0_9BACT|nr:hypothetical protein [Mycoplasmopsis columbinasalis]VEU78107.1 Uncharacterised protein [Mycoplasmopsis columbinasalis]